MQFDKDIFNYIEEHSTKPSEALNKIERLANIKLTRPRMISGALQGNLLKILVGISGAKKVLEIGTFAAYASVAMAEALPSGGELHTIEIDDEMQDFIMESISLSNVADKIHLHIGSAFDIIPKLLEKHSFNIVYIDANKREYTDYYNMLIDNLPNGALILADNTLWDGKVLEENPKNKDLQTIKIKEFNNFVASDERVDVVILPLRDGLSLIRKK